MNSRKHPKISNKNNDKSDNCGHEIPFSLPSGVLSAMNRGLLVRDFVTTNSSTVERPPHVQLSSAIQRFTMFPLRRAVLLDASTTIAVAAVGQFEEKSSERFRCRLLLEGMRTHMHRARSPATRLHCNEHNQDNEAVVRSKQDTVCPVSSCRSASLRRPNTERNDLIV